MRALPTCLALATFLVPFAATAATVQMYRVDVTGALTDFEILGLSVTNLDPLNNPFPEPSLDAIEADALASNADYGDYARDTTGSVIIEYSGMFRGDNFVSCSGILRELCGSFGVTFDPVTGTSTQDNGNANVSFNQSSFYFENGATLPGTLDGYFYDSRVVGVSFEFVLDSITVTPLPVPPVPLPAGGVLLISALAGLGAVRRRVSGAISG